MDLRERIEALTEPQGECGVWRGSLVKSSPVVTNGRGAVSVRRTLWEAEHGPLGPEFVVIGACSTPLCVRHIAATTSSKGALKGSTPPAVNAIKTHCINGHALVGENLHIKPNGDRRCRECHRLRAAAAYYSDLAKTKAQRRARWAAHREELNAKQRARRRARRAANHAATAAD
jgi:hypothetical protein